MFRNLPNQVNVSGIKPSKLQTDFKSVVDQLTTFNQSVITKELHLLKSSTDPNSIQILSEILAQKAMTQPHLCSTIIKLCRELYILDKAIDCDNFITDEIKNVLTSEFAAIFNVQPLIAPPSHIMNILQCSAEMASEFQYGNEIVKNQIQAVQNYAKTDKDNALPVLLEFMKFIQLYFPGKFESSCEDVLLFLKAEFQETSGVLSEKLRYEIREVLTILEGTSTTESTSSFISEYQSATNIIDVLLALTPANAKSFRSDVEMVNGLKELKECCEILLNKSVKYPTMMTQFVKILEKIVGRKHFVKARRELVQLTCETAFNNLFDDIDRNKLKMPVEDAFNLTNFIGEVIKRTVSGIKSGFNCLQKLHSAAEAGNIVNIDLLLVFVDKTSRNFASVNRFPKDTFMFLLAQRYNCKLSKKSRINLAKSIEMLQNINEINALSSNVHPEFDAIVSDISSSTWDEIEERLKALNADYSPFSEASIDCFTTKLIMNGIQEPDSAQMTATVLLNLPTVLLSSMSKKKARKVVKERASVEISQLLDSTLQSEASLHLSINIMFVACCACQLAISNLVVFLEKLHERSTRTPNDPIRTAMIILFFKICGEGHFIRLATPQLQTDFLLILKLSLATTPASSFVYKELAKTVKHLENTEEFPMENLMSSREWVELINDEVENEAINCDVK